jgi:hypothetical protein
MYKEVNRKRTGKKGGKEVTIMGRGGRKRVEGKGGPPKLKVRLIDYIKNRIIHIIFCFL